MSHGGPFTLVQRDERSDKYFTASDELRKRLNTIRVERLKRKETNLQPTIADVEKTHAVPVRAAYKPYVAVASEYAQVKPDGGDNASSIGQAGGTVEFTFPSFGHFTSDIAVHVRFEAIGTQNPVTTTGPTPLSFRYRYCAFPGIRLFQHTELKSNGILIDDYTPDDVIEYSQTFIKDDFVSAFERAHGQQQLKMAESFNPNGFTQVMLYRDGPQTPAFYQQPLEMFVPMKFWFCADPSQALLNDLMPASQRKIVLKLAPITQILQAFDQSGNQVPLPFTKLAMSISLYVNNLYVNPEVYDIFATRVGFQMVRVHRRQKTTLQSAHGRVLHDQLKYPLEYAIVGVRDPTNSLDFDNWPLFGRARVRTPATSLLTPAAIYNSAITTNQLIISNSFEATTLDSILTTIGVTAHGITLYKPTNVVFYNSYLPMRYMQTSQNVTSTDTSIWLIPFCLTPGQFAPSGYYNLSTSREFYIDYTGTVSVSAPAEMVTTASVLNFLVRKGDSCLLRYAL